MPFEDAEPRGDTPLLIYSLAEFRELIFDAFAAASVRSVVEVGSEEGLFTDVLLGWASDHDGRVTAVDPAPSERVRQLARTSPLLDLSEATSHQALETLPPHDAYLLDGDHNYFTVRGELDRIAVRCAADDVHPLVLLQDIGWPTGRRDMYYNPDALPADAVLDHSYEGAVPWSDEPVGFGGFRGAGHFAVARANGGPGNGVLTALEDFLAEQPGYRAELVPYCFGLAVIFKVGSPWEAQLGEVVRPYSQNPALPRLEANRLRLFLKVLELQDLLVQERAHHAAERANLQAALEEQRARAAIADQRARGLAAGA